MTERDESADTRLQSDRTAIRVAINIAILLAVAVLTGLLMGLASNAFGPSARANGVVIGIVVAGLSTVLTARQLSAAQRPRALRAQAVCYVLTGVTLLVLGQWTPTIRGIAGAGGGLLAFGAGLALYDLWRGR